jgi:hypothetical protein
LASTLRVIAAAFSSIAAAWSSVRGAYFDLEGEGLLFAEALAASLVEGLEAEIVVVVAA